MQTRFKNSQQLNKNKRKQIAILTHFEPISFLKLSSATGMSEDFCMVSFDFQYFTKWNLGFFINFDIWYSWK